MQEARQGQSNTSVESRAVAPGDVSQGEGIQLGGEKGRKEAGPGSYLFCSIIQESGTQGHREALHCLLVRRPEA